jgi:hypothetical protein
MEVMAEENKVPGGGFRSTASPLGNTFAGDIPVLEVVGKAFNQDLVSEDDRVLKRATMVIAIPGMVLSPSKRSIIRIEDEDVELVGGTNDDQRTIDMQEVGHAVEMVDVDRRFPRSTPRLKVEGDEVLVVQHIMPEPTGLQVPRLLVPCLDVVHVFTINGDRRVQDSTARNMRPVQIVIGCIEAEEHVTGDSP